MMVGSLFSSTADGGMSARIGSNDHVVSWVEVTNIELLLHVHVHVLIAMHGLLALMVATRIVIPSLVELIDLIDGVVILCSILAEIALITLMDWITSSSGCSLLAKLSLGNGF